MAYFKWTSEKTVYYLYADYLEANKKPLFKAKFEAWKDGPVDTDVYRLKKHHVGELKKLMILG